MSRLGKIDLLDGRLIQSLVIQNTNRFFNRDGSKRYMKATHSWKTVPHICEHCDSVMTVSGRLPKKDDLDGWYHWISYRDSYFDLGLKKIHEVYASVAGDTGICKTCHDLHQTDEWLDGYDPEVGD